MYIAGTYMCSPCSSEKIKFKYSHKDIIKTFYQITENFRISVSFNIEKLRQEWAAQLNRIRYAKRIIVA